MRMQRSPSPTYRLADHLLDGRLSELVARRRREGRSWRWIAHEIWELTNGQVTPSDVTLRSWFPDENGGEAA